MVGKSEWSEALELSSNEMKDDTFPMIFRHWHLCVALMIGE